MFGRLRKGHEGEQEKDGEKGNETKGKEFQNFQANYS
jgi:hypothetical protein